MDINLGLSATATGTVDAILATYSPAPTYVDKKILFLRTIGANTIVNPTINVNGLGVRTITKGNGLALVAGDLLGDVVLMYDLANLRFELLTPKTVTTATPTLSQVLTAGNTVAVQAKVITPNFTVETDGLAARYGLATTNGAIHLTSYLDNPSGVGAAAWWGTKSLHDLYIFTNDGAAQAVFRANKNFALLNETASTIASFDANKDVKSLPLATYPSLAELSYVKGLTSAVQPQINALSYSSVYFTDNGNGITPADSTTYYVGATQLAVTTTENTIRRFHFAKACTIVGCEVTIKNLGAAGTGEASTVFIRLNNTTNYNISNTIVTTVQAPAVNFANSDSLAIPVAAGDFIIPGWLTPAWVTNPGLCVITFLIKVKY